MQLSLNDFLHLFSISQIMNFLLNLKFYIIFSILKVQRWRTSRCSCETWSAARSWTDSPWCWTMAGRAGSSWSCCTRVKGTRTRTWPRWGGTRKVFGLPTCRTPPAPQSTSSTECWRSAMIGMGKFLCCYEWNHIRFAINILKFK